MQILVAVCAAKSVSYKYRAERRQRRLFTVPRPGGRTGAKPQACCAVSNKSLARRPSGGSDNRVGSPAGSAHPSTRRYELPAADVDMCYQTPCSVAVSLVDNKPHQECWSEGSSPNCRRQCLMAGFYSYEVYTHTYVYRQLPCQPLLVSEALKGQGCWSLEDGCWINSDVRKDAIPSPTNLPLAVQ